MIVDDLDRCPAGFAVELLEAIHTLVRSELVGDARTTSWRWDPPAPIAFLIPVDLAWLRRAYEEEYKEFTAAVTEAGRPLGYQFLAKLFDAAVPVPPLSGALHRRYVDNLLDQTMQRLGHAPQQPATGPMAGPLPATTTGVPPPDPPSARPVEQLKEETKGAGDTESLRRIELEAASLTDGRDRTEVLRKVSEKRFDPEIRRAAEQHFLQTYAGLMERNPRGVKRVLNEWGVRLAIRAVYDPQDQVSDDHLARWTILNQRWPLLVERLGQLPQLPDPTAVPTRSEVAEHLGGGLGSLLGDARVRQVWDLFVGNGADDAPADPTLLKAMRQIAGLDHTPPLPVPAPPDGADRAPPDGAERNGSEVDVTPEPTA